jgi:hypothetical protein
MFMYISFLLFQHQKSHSDFNSMPLLDMQNENNVNGI